MKNEAVIRHRLDLYYEQTGAVVGGYAGRGILIEVDGVGGIDAVTGSILAAIGAFTAGSGSLNHWNRD